MYRYGCRNVIIPSPGTVDVLEGSIVAQCGYGSIVASHNLHGLHVISLIGRVGHHHRPIRLSAC